MAKFYPKETELIRDLLGSKKNRPLLVLLDGDLGVGKTTFTKELLSSYGLSPDEIQSPTFLKLLEYDVPKLGLCLHIDAYRMEDFEDCAKLSLESYEDFELCLLEWPEIFTDYWKQNPELLRVLSFGEIVRIGFVLDAASGERSLQIEKGLIL
ncbi:tRNA (adenosine(37)-N6)-threonylcarbamoyltransferase complex ATPase subunit type 1 TsaE [bacterium]|nr:tRNA (adenosine(37)-N6)-threonylcarbamoyltransferase complex ATPase subunit type 1 TsaE [bacterium]